MYVWVWCNTLDTQATLYVVFYNIFDTQAEWGRVFYINCIIPLPGEQMAFVASKRVLNVHSNTVYF